MNSENIKKIITILQNNKDETPKYYLINNFDSNLFESTDPFEELKNLKNIFFMANRNRVILVVWICHSIRVLFEKYKYTEINLPYDAYDVLREEYNTKSLNRQLLCELFGKNSPNSRLAYNDFVKYEEKYIKEYNEYASDEDKMSTITHIVPKTKASLIDLNSDFMKNFNSERDFNILYKRAIGKTLDELGTEYGVTRERTRQIEAKPKTAIKRWIENNHEQISNVLGNNGLIEEKKAISVLGEKSWFIFKFVIKSEKTTPLPIKYNSDLDIFFSDPENIFIKCLAEARNKITTAKNAPANFAFYMQTNGFPFFTENLTLKYFNATGKYIYGDTLCDGKANLGKAILMLTENKYANGIKITDLNELTAFAGDLQAVFGINTNTGRSLTTRIQDVLVMTNRGVYSNPNIINFPEDLRNEIYMFLNSMDEDRITYNKLYEKFSDALLSKTNITNPYFLHGALKYYSNENALMFLKNYVCKPDVKSIKSDIYFQKVEDYLLKAKGPVQMDKIIQDLPGWTETFVRYSLIYFPQIAVWGNKTYINLKNIVLTKKEKDIIVSELNELINNDYDYTSSYKIFDVISNKHPSILKNHKIDNENNLFHVIQYNFSDKFFFRKPHIIKIDTPDAGIFNTDQLINKIVEKEFSGEIDRDKLIKRINQLYGDNNSSVSLSIQRILKNYIKVSSGLFVNKSVINLSESDLKKVENIISKNMKKNVALVIESFKDWDQFPEFSSSTHYSWNPYILCEVINMYKLPFRIIGQVYNTANNSSAYIVKIDSPYTTKSEVSKAISNRKNV